MVFSFIVVNIFNNLYYYYNSFGDEYYFLGGVGGGLDFKKFCVCELCRGFKVCCDLDLVDLDGFCKRCVKVKCECVIIQFMRKWVKKMDLWVVELEKKIDMLIVSLQVIRL